MHNWYNCYNCLLSQVMCVINACDCTGQLLAYTYTWPRCNYANNSCEKRLHNQMILACLPGRNVAGLRQDCCRRGVVVATAICVNCANCRRQQQNEGDSHHTRRSDVSVFKRSCAANSGRQINNRVNNHVNLSTRKATPWSRRWLIKFARPQFDSFTLNHSTACEVASKCCIRHDMNTQTYQTVELDQKIAHNS